MSRTGAECNGSSPLWWWRLLLVVGAVACAAVALAGCAGDEDASGVAAPPPADATPAQVVVAFVDAWSAGDHERTRQLSTEAFWEKFSSSSDVAGTTFSDVRIVSSTERPPGDPGRSGDVTGYAHVVYVLFDADVRQRPVMTWNDGRHPWGFELVRDSAEDRWLIGSSGLG